MFHHKLNFKKGPARIATSKAVAGGFTLIELLVVVAIIGVLAAIVLFALNGGNAKGKNAAIKSNLSGARTQAEVFFNTNTVANLTFTSVCTNGAVGGVQGIGAAVLSAAKTSGLSVFANDVAGSTTTATCNDSASNWAAEVPLVGGGMWCVDSANKSIQTAGSSLSSGTDYTCN